LLSSQSTEPLPMHVPPLHVSVAVQVSPSSQLSVLFVVTQPSETLQVSSVHGLLSSQLGGGPPLHVPPLHVSFVVQALVSSHGSVLKALTHPVAALHESSVHGLLSLQFGADPGMHAPLEHASVSVQASPSSQGTESRFWHTPVLSHSTQSSGSPPPQAD
jgi:hypothetical protein